MTAPWSRQHVGGEIADIAATQFPREPVRNPEVLPKPAHRLRGRKGDDVLFRLVPSRRGRRRAGRCRCRLAALDCTRIAYLRCRRAGNECQ